jgi:hypothetical protein
LLLLVAAIEVVAWSAVLPPLQGPDEDAHYSYAQYLAETGKKPAIDHGTGIASAEADSAQAGFNLFALIGRPQARPFWAPSEVKAWNAYEAKLGPESRATGSGPNAVAKNPRLYYVYAGVPYRVGEGARFFTRLFWMRMANGLLLLGTIVLTWMIAAELFRSVVARTVATAAAALVPMAAFMGAVVNPDTMLTTIWAAALLLALRLVGRGFSPLRVGGLVALCIASVFVHGRGLPLVPFAVVALVLAWLRHRPPLRATLAWTGVGLVALVGGYAVYRSARDGGVYGGELSYRKSFNLGGFASFVWQFYLPKLDFMAVRPGPAFGYRQMFIEGYLPGVFGQEDARFSAEVYDAIRALAFAGFAVLVAGLIARREALRGRWDLFVLLAVLVVFALGLLHLASYRAVTDPNAPNALIVGRYLLPLTPVFGLAVAFVVALLRPRWRAYGAALVVALGVVLQLAALGITAARFYG